MKKPETAQEAVIVVASQVSRFMMALSEDQNERCVHLAIPEDDFIYAEALLMWEGRNRNENDIFSTEDAFMLEFRKELQEEFGLPVMTREEAREKEKERGFRTTKVTGIPEVTKLMN
jgi:hypothetical protein